MSDKINDIVVPILQSIQGDVAVMRDDISLLKENSNKLDQRMKSVEAHMSGFMTSARYLESEMDSLRGRIEALE